MKKLAAALALVVGGSLLVSTGCLDQSAGARTYQGPLLRYHYVGREHLPPGTNAAIYKAIEALPATAELRAEVAQKLALASLRFWSKDLPPGVIDQSALLRPLLDDLLMAAALVEVRGPAGQTESVVALELADDRAQLWDAKLRQLAKAWQLGDPKPVTEESVTGWEVRRAQAPTTLQFFRVGQWVFLGLGQDPGKALAPLLVETRKNKRPLPLPRDNFLELSVDFPGLRSWFPILNRYQLPAAVAGLSARGGNVRTDVKFHYSARIPWKPEPWLLPTNFVSEPLTSFTAMQGVGPLLQAVAGSMDLGMKPLPNQFYSWGVSHPQCRIYFAVPVPGDSRKVMNDVSLKVPQFVTAKLPTARNDFFYESNRAHLAWASLPHVFPVIYAADRFLVGGNVPLPVKRIPVPDQLFSQVRARDNLVYYDWEYTQERITHGKQFYQLACLATGHSLPSTNSASKRWLSAITPKLTNTATEITYAGPQELALARKSDLGLTGFELATLSTWIDSAGFPFEFSLPPALPTPPKDAAPRRATSAPPRAATAPGSPPKAATGAATNAPPPKTVSPAPPPKKP